MRRRIITLILTMALMMSLMPLASYAASELPDLNDNTMYYTPDYRSGDCILSSAKSMLRRAAIARGSYNWDSITNTTLRSAATVSGRLFRNTFTYTNDGLSYKIVNQELSGNASNKMKDVTALLANHPEGIIIWGPSAATSGPHAVLIVGHAGGVLYAVDSTHNTYKSNAGIEPWGRTTMKTIDKCTDVWYISTINGVSASADPTGESTMCATGINQPVSITQGKGFDVTGTVQSNYRISSVTISVIDSDGRTAISATSNPASFWFPLSHLDSAVRFGTLSAGRYTYRITAADEKKGNAVVHENSFEVVSPVRGFVNNIVEKVTDSTLRGESISQPDTLTQGSSFAVKGKVVSNYKITYVSAAVTDAYGNTVIGAEARPDAKSYKLANIDAKIKFGKLAAGTYNYVVTASDKQGTVTLVNKEFTVTAKSASAAQNDGTISISSVRAPASIRKGKSFSIRGTVKSSAKITHVRVQVLNQSGKAVISASAKPKKTSYSIRKLDSKVKFGKLKKGSYIYIIQAKTGSDWQTLVIENFTVR